MLDVKKLTKTFPNKETPAVEGVSFVLQPQKILSIFGKSGSGKTTLLKMIAGLIQPNSGSVELSGEIIKGPAEKLVPGHEEIKVVFQDFQLKHKMTVSENIDYTLLSYEKSYRADRLDKVISMCLLEDIKDQFVEELSGGQQQRVAIARALANEPQLLLMDEPFSNLDISAKSKLRKAIKNIITETSSSVIFVSHDPDEVLVISDEIIVIEKGKVLQTGNPENIYHHPIEISVAEMFSRINSVTLNKKTSFYRPEAFKITDLQNADIKGEIIEIEFLGKYQYLNIKTTDGDLISVLYFSDDKKVGDQLNVIVSGNQLF